MSKFNKGDKCVIIKALCMLESNQQHVGKVCTVTEVIKTPLLLAMLMGPVDSFFVRFDDGSKGLFCQHCLRLAQPPKQDRGDWEQIKKITGWTPQAVPA